MSGRAALRGKYRVRGTDKFNYDEWTVTDLDSKAEAIALAQKKTDECRRLASDFSIATVFDVYDSEGKTVYRGHW